MLVFPPIRSNERGNEKKKTSTGPLFLFFSFHPRLLSLAFDIDKTAALFCEISFYLLKTKQRSGV